MKYFSLVWAQLFRSRTRTLLTLLSVVAAFLLFGMLDSVRVAFSSGGSVEGANRLVTASRLSITQSLPIRLEAQIRQVSGVRDVTYGMWFGGIYQDPKNFFPNFSVAPNYFDVYRELQIDPAQLQDWQQTRTGAIVGETLAKQFGWKVGDTIPLQATIFPRGGSNDWPLELKGIYRSKDRALAANEERQLMMNWKYFDESNDYIKNQVSWYTVTLDNPDQSSRVAQAIDAISANSDHETKTQTESAFQQAFVKQFADIGMIVTSIMGAVFFTLLLLTGNTMAQAVRERIPELATLKTLGFKDSTVLTLVMVESVLLIGLGGLLGMGLAALILPAISPKSMGMLPPHVPTPTWLVGIVLIVVIGIVVGLLPALRAKRLKIVDALAGR
ncbi:MULTISPECIES: ABC transporter permease [Stenotrophomonas]|uniref:FtsX-like permease family protein n=1 Tax=Stenotrophomonas lactitubi TaxID=2045214 RepID=A0AAW4GCL6_9GAMM|nr:MULTISPECIES: FtsX-like permease family protein [Stenotrophomonas]MCO7470466.1 FtsX-like permease family protein [Stenotrophomonas maltophilia]MBM9912402.1 FtsX-like permease family protein [Stenotrophomonas lactitubi]MBM9923334.1 FtsX-like permease family protein [Stenotrophomonas lactitubi]MBM9938135.1 FtsX-like permease family protein [Stenotrophomonas lactitubi]NYT97514.1 FtsX-like permease family protein [Stenotrophomonas sp. SbOxS2]